MGNALAIPHTDVLAKKDNCYILLRSKTAYIAGGLISKRDDWRKGPAHLTGDSAKIYTDGSKLEGAIGIGVYS